MKRQLQSGFGLSSSAWRSNSLSLPLSAPFTLPQSGPASSTARLEQGQAGAGEWAGSVGGLSGLGSACLACALAAAGA